MLLDESNTNNPNGRNKVSALIIYMKKIQCDQSNSLNKDLSKSSTKYIKLF